jgi:phosphate:Na+ symporter
MVVGFINAGLLTFQQSLGVIIGANIGTTVTPQITAFDLDAYALPLLGIGFLLYFISRRRMPRQLGLAVMGFGMLFFGLTIMKFAVGGYRDTLRGLLALAASGGPLGYLSAFLVSMLVTAVIQSSAASIVMIQALAAESVLTDVSVAIPLILGAHVGTCVTALLASLRSSFPARRAAVAHLLFNVIGTGLAVLLLPFYNYVIPLSATSLPHQIANAHLAIKLVNAAIFMPFLSYYGRLILLLMRGTDKLSAAPQHLDFHVIRRAQEAMECARKEIQRMYTAALSLLDDSVHAFLSNDEHAQEEIVKREDRLDDLYRSVGEYLVAISKHTTDTELALKPALLLHVASDVERIGDHAENIVELARLLSGARLPFSRAAFRDIAELDRLVGTLGKHVAAMFEGGGEPEIATVLTDKQALNACVDRCLDSHVARLEEGTCNAMGGILFVELIMNLRRVANHLRNIAVSLGNAMPEQSFQVNRIKQELAADVDLRGGK